MTSPHRCGVAVALALMLASAATYADPATPTPAAPGTSHIQSPSTLTTDGGSVLRLPPGYWMDEPTYKQEDDDLKALQTSVTRLSAENKSYAASAASWQPGWKTLLGTLITGVATGWYLHSKL